LLEIIVEKIKLKNVRFEQIDFILLDVFMHNVRVRLRTPILANQSGSRRLRIGHREPTSTLAAEATSLLSDSPEATTIAVKYFAGRESQRFSCPYIIIAQFLEIAMWLGDVVVKWAKELAE